MLVRNPFTHDSRVEKEARTLRDAGYAVTVVCEARDGLPLIEERDGVTVRRVARPTTQLLGLRFLRYQRALADALRATDPHILHAHDTDALVPVARVAGERSLPFVYDAHELWLGRPPRERSALYVLAFRTYYAAVERLLIPRAAATVTVSPPIARHLERRYRLPRVELVPNYPELGESQPPKEIRALPATERIPAGAPLILHLGGYTPERGIDELIAALPDVPHAHLILLGAAASDQAVAQWAMRRGVADRVHVLAPVPPDEVVAYAASATIGVAPIVPTTLNNAYSLPNKLFQYMAAGLPVLCSTASQMREVVEGSGAGVAVDTQDPAAIAAGLRQLLGDGDRLREMGLAARRAVEERYHWGVSAATLRAVYEKLSHPSVAAAPSST